MESATTDLTVRKSVTVRRPVEEAFRLFTEAMGSWWPSGTHSVHKDAVESLVLEGRVGGEVYERARGGERAHWATVLEWEPPTRFVLEWKVNPDAVAPTEVEVTFTPEGEGTRVDLEHRGWERLGDAAAEGAESYDTGWDYVLAKYAHAA